MRRSLKISLIIVLALAITGVAGAVFLSSSAGEGMIRSWLEGYLSDTIGVAVTLGGFETNIWSHVQIDSLAVQSSVGSDTTQMAYVGRIRIGYSIPGLLGSPIEVDEVSVDSVVLALDRDSLGNWGLPLLDAPTDTTDSGTESGAGFRIGSISLSRAHLSYNEQELLLDLFLSGAALSARGDSAGTYTGRFTADSIGLAYDTVTVELTDLAIDASVDDSLIQLNHLSTRCAEIDIAAQGSVGFDSLQSIAMSISLEGPLDSLVRTVGESIPVERGSIKIAANINGNVASPEISAHVDLLNLLVHEVAIESVATQLVYAENRLSVDTFVVRAFGGAIRGRAATTINDAEPVSLSAEIEGLNIAPVWQTVFAKSSLYTGQVQGHITARGLISDVSSWTAEVALATNDLVYANRTISPLRLAANVRADTVDVSFTHGSDTVLADLMLNEDSVQGTFDIRIPDLHALARLIDQPDLAGQLRADGEIRGLYTDPYVRAAVSGSHIMYQGFPVDSLTAEGVYDHGRLVFDRLVCSGDIESLEDASPFGLDSLGGSLTYSCRMAGATDSLAGDVAIVSKQTQYGSYGLDSLSMRAEIDRSRILLTDLEAVRDDIRATLTAEYDTLTTSGAFDLRLSRRTRDDLEPSDTIATLGQSLGAVNGQFQFDLPSSQISADIQGSDLNLQMLSLLSEDSTVVQGLLSFDASIHGPTGTPDGTCAATIRNMRYNEYQVDSIIAHGRIADRTLSLDSLESFSLDNRLHVSGSLRMDVSEENLYYVPEDALCHAELTTRDFDLSMLGDVLKTTAEIEGKASANLVVNGSLASPHVNGWLTAEIGRLLLDPAGLPTDSIHASLSFADTVFTIDSITGRFSDINVRATGSMIVANMQSALVDLNMGVGEFGGLTVSGYMSETAMQLSVMSDTLNLSVFQPFLTDIDSLSGHLNCGVNIAGDPALPDINGTVDFESLSLAMPKHYLRISDGFARIQFDKSHVTIDSVVARVNGGRASCYGHLTHEKFELADIDLSLRADSIRLQEPDVYVVTIDSVALQYGKLGENYVLRGDVSLGEARFTRGLSPTSVLPWVTSLETVDYELPELVARSRLDVRIRESNNLWVDNNLARIRIRAALGVIGTPMRPNFTGLVKIEEGYLLYLDRRFQINEGSAFFSDPARFNPDIKLEASTRVRSYRRMSAEEYAIYIRATGLLDQLQYGLYSEPALEQADIVALLTLGATRSELTSSGNDGNEGGLTTVLKDRAAMLTSKRVSGYLSRKAGAIFGFDEFTIQGNLFQFNESWGPQLIASKRLARNVSLTYSTTVGHLNDQSVRLGYRLTPRWSLMGETDSQGRSGLDLKYGISFK